MSSAAGTRRLATAADLAALPGHVRAEVLGGVIVERASPSAEHGYAQAGLTAFLWSRFNRRTGGPPPGGWWLLTEVEIELEQHEVYVPDVVGWRRERVPERPLGRPVTILPDWVCEVLSPSNAKDDLVTKLRAYQRARVPHYWVIDPQNQILMVYRWQEQGYTVVLSASRGERVRAEPFAEAELLVGILFGEEEEATS